MKTREGISNSTEIICVGKTVINSFGFHEMKSVVIIIQERKQKLILALNLITFLHIYYYFYTFSKNEKVYWTAFTVL